MATRRIKPRTPDPKRGQSSEEYWREREARQRAENIRNEAKTAEKINRIFATVQDDIQQEIDSFYHRYAKDEGIDLIEARRRVSQLDIKKYERLAQQYVKAAHEGAADVAFSEEANEQMRLYNTTMRINRLEMLKARCGIRAMSGYSEAEKLINDELEERAYSEYERLSGILGNTVQFNENLVRSIVNASYQNATWSDRLWNNQSLLSEQIGAQLAQGILTGKGSRVLAANIQKLTGQSAYNCLRLMRTELRRVQTAAAEQSMRDNGVRQYKFMVENAINPCDECLNLDGHVYDLDELAPGKTAPPIHPNCHCATAPYVDEEKWQRWLDGPAQEGVPWADFENGDVPEVPAGPVFTPADSIEKAQEFAQQFLSGGYKSLVNYQGVDLKYVNEFNRALHDVFSQYDPKYKLRSIQPMNMREKRFKGSTAEAAYQWGMRDMFFSKGYFKSQKDFAKHEKQYRDLMDTVLSGVDRLIDKLRGQEGAAARKQLKYAEALKSTQRSIFGGCDPYSSVVHELGHYLDDNLFRAQMKKDGFNLSESFEKFSKNVSGYATSTTQEYVAESFAAYMLGDRSCLDPELVALFERAKK